MTADPTNLLRMLEPATRPNGTPGLAPSRAVNAPFESRPFEQLLQQAQAEQRTEAAANAADKAEAHSPLNALAQFSRIENASLRQQLEAVYDTPPTNDSTDSPDLTPSE